jgi:hypothetical protein
VIQKIFYRVISRVFRFLRHEVQFLSILVIYGATMPFVDSPRPASHPNRTNSPVRKSSSLRRFLQPRETPDALVAKLRPKLIRVLTNQEAISDFMGALATSLG